MSDLTAGQYLAALLLDLNKLRAASEAPAPAMPDARDERIAALEAALREMIRGGEHEGPCDNEFPGERCDIHWEHSAKRREEARAALAGAPAPANPDQRDERIAALEAALSRCLEIFGDAEWEYGDGTPFDVKAVRAALAGGTTLAAHDAEVRQAALEEAAKVCDVLAGHPYLPKGQVMTARNCAGIIRALAAKEKP